MADVLKRTVRARVLLTNNERTMFDEEYYEKDAAFTESTHQRIVLGTNMASSAEIDLSGVNTGAVFFFECDREVSVGINSTTNLLVLGDNGTMLFTGAFSHVYVQNNSHTYTSTVEIVVTD
jgi:hypothetical protein